MYRWVKWSSVGHAVAGPGTQVCLNSKAGFSQVHPTVMTRSLTCWHAAHCSTNRSRGSKAPDSQLEQEKQQVSQMQDISGARAQKRQQWQC